MRGYVVLWVAVVTTWASSVPVYGSTRGAQNGQCQSLITQLEAMQAAQRSLLQSMVRKNDTISDSLSDYADEFSMKGNRLSKLDLQSIRETSRSFQRHKVRESMMVEKFERSSRELISKVSVCLANADHSLRASNNQ